MLPRGACKKGSRNSCNCLILCSSVLQTRVKVIREEPLMILVGAGPNRGKKTQRLLAREIKTQLNNSEKKTQLNNPEEKKTQLNCPEEKKNSTQQPGRKKKLKSTTWKK